MTENIPEADPKYAEVAEKYEEDVLVIGVPEFFTNFSMFGSHPRKPQCITPTFQYFFLLLQRSGIFQTLHDHMQTCTEKTPLESRSTAWNRNVTNTLYTNNVKYYGKNKNTLHHYVICEDSPVLDFFSLDLDFHHYQV